MKRFLLTLTAVLAFAVAALAQTPEVILGKMSEVMNVGPDVGVALTTDMKIPILGTLSSRVYSLGGKSRMEMTVKDEKAITWVDGTTTYTYEAGDNEITIADFKEGRNSESNGNLEMAENITAGYDVKLQKETEKYWEFLCTKRKDNKDKDAPRKMTVSVWKDSYILRSLITTVKGITVTMRNVSFGVKEKDVTFNLSDYPDAKIVDKRGKK